MLHGVIQAGQQSWDAAEEARWKQDAMLELHNDDALWAFLMRVSKEMRMMDRSCLNDQALWRLLDMEIFNWEGTDKLMNQAQQATRLETAISTRQVCGGERLDRRRQSHS